MIKICTFCQNSSNVEFILDPDPHVMTSIKIEEMIEEGMIEGIEEMGVTGGMIEEIIGKMTTVIEVGGTEVPIGAEIQMIKTEGEVQEETGVLTDEEKEVQIEIDIVKIIALIDTETGVQIDIGGEVQTDTGTEVQIDTNEKVLTDIEREVLKNKGIAVQREVEIKAQKETGEMMKIKIEEKRIMKSTMEAGSIEAEVEVMIKMVISINIQILIWVRSLKHLLNYYGQASFDF